MWRSGWDFATSNVTYAIYGHLVPPSLERALEVLNAEYTERHAAA
jgi:hypothetical protein